MKTRFLILLFFLLYGIVSAQDTIFVKNGEIIPAIIVEKNNTEIKYRKFGKPESAAVYSIFVSDVSSIRFSDGIIADYNQPGETLQTVSKRPVDFAGTMKVIRFSLGVEGEYFMRSMNDKLLEFWRFYTAKNKAEISGSRVSFPLLFKMGFVIGNSGRNWLGDEVQVIILPKDAIYASDYNNSYEIKLSNVYANIIMYYGHTINHKRNLVLIFEPGYDISFMTGYLKFADTKYTEVGTVGMGFHAALGLEWVIAKRLNLSGRLGYRYTRIKEYHQGPNGFSYFYSVPSADKKRLLIDWKGTYASVGLCYNFYLRMRGVKLE